MNADPRPEERSLSLHLSDRDGGTLADKARQAYFWILNNAVISPHYDMVYGLDEGRKLTFPNGDMLPLPSEPSYSSYILIPLLTLLTKRKALLVGGPGRGKTAVAMLLGMVAGYPYEEVRRAVQHGHPQLTVADLLGSPLPSDLMKAEDMEEIRISWKQWLGLRVKIVDEYNRIPTKTQSALLSLMAEGYAEQMGQVVVSKKSAWFLTANDESGGGTFQVIEALKDRIDVTVRALTFNPWFLSRLLERVERDVSPEELVPKEIQFTEEELNQVHRDILNVQMPEKVVARLAFFMGQLDFCQRASRIFEYKSKDVLRLSGIRLGSVCNEDCPLDKHRHLCTQAEMGPSVRAYITLLHFAKALAYFRGTRAVSVEDLGQIIPFILHEKIAPNKQSPFFEGEENKLLLFDKVAWIQNMFVMAMKQYDALSRDASTPVRDLLMEMDKGLAELSASEADKRLKRVLECIKKYQKAGELSPTTYADLIVLKSLYMRYQNYLLWLQSKSPSPGQ